MYDGLAHARAGIVTLDGHCCFLRFEIENRFLGFVMAGLDPAIPFRRARCSPKRDARGQARA
jgi:hypothetical protein